MAYGTSIKLPGEFFDPPTINMDPQNFVAKLQQHMAELKPLKSPSNRKQNIFVHKDLKTVPICLFVSTELKALEPPYEGPYTVQKSNGESYGKVPNIKYAGGKPVTSCGELLYSYVTCSNNFVQGVFVVELTLHLNFATNV
ncbi:retrovirus-related Pol polyprotein from transposon opus [Trichonephila clavipes]|nr:retrovirus-related Pol polyprotein from transposon opus [Trichonephila clavipes]